MLSMHLCISSSLMAKLRSWLTLTCFQRALSIGFVIFTSAEWRRLCFQLCLSVCLSIYQSLSFSVSNTMDKLAKRFSWNLQDRSNMEQETYWNISGILFHAWLDCVTFLKLGMAEVCILRVLLVMVWKLAYSSLTQVSYHLYHKTRKLIFLFVTSLDI